MLPLETPRLVLRRLAALDVPAFAAYRADPAVAFIRGQRRQAAGVPGRWTQIALALLRSDALIGDLGLHIDAAAARPATVSITLAPAYHGLGYATEALTGLLDHLFGDGAIDRISAEVDPRNQRSWTLLERLGMRREGERLRSLWFKGELADELHYAIEREEWWPRRGPVARGR